MAIATKLLGWLELAMAVFAAYICGLGLYELFVSGPNGPFDLAHEWAPFLVAAALPLSLSLAWGGWHLVKRKEWLHQVTPLLVTLAVVGFIVATDY